MLTILLWQCEKANRASEEASFWYRRYSAEATGDRVTSVERYEVIFWETKGEME